MSDVSDVKTAHPPLPSRATNFIGLFKDMPPGLLLALSSGVVITFGLIQGKIVAVLLGPTGIALLGQVGGLFTLATMILASGPSAYMVRQLAASRDGKHTVEVRQIIGLMLVLGTVMAFALGAGSSFVAQLALGDSNLWWAVLSVAVSILGVTVTSIVRALLQGHHRIAGLALIDIFQSLAGLAAVALTVFLFGALGALANWPIYAGLSAIIAIIVFSARASPAISDLVAWPRPQTLRTIGVFSTATLAGIIAHQASFVVVRSQLIHSLGEKEAGLYHAALSISLQLISVVLFSQSTYLFPKLSSLTHDPRRLLAEIDSFLLTIVGLFTPMAIILIMNGELLFRILLAPSFLEGLNLLEVQLGLDLLRLIPWALAMVFLPLGRTWLHGIINLVWPGIFIVLSELGIPIFGVYAPLISTFITYVTITIICFVILSRDYGYRFPSVTARSIALSIGFIVFAIAFTNIDDLGDVIGKGSLDFELSKSTSLAVSFAESIVVGLAYVWIAGPRTPIRIYAIRVWRRLRPPRS